jgi:hypothetical protein
MRKARLKEVGPRGFRDGWSRVWHENHLANRGPKALLSRSILIGMRGGEIQGSRRGGCYLPSWGLAGC